MQLFSAEVPGPTPDKLHPQVKDTAKRLWFIYLIFTVAETLLLWAGEMGLFDAVCHSLTTMATGGYSTKQASIAYWDSPYIHYVITCFHVSWPEPISPCPILPCTGKFRKDMEE